MEEALVGFNEIFTNETFDAIRKAVNSFLAQTGSTNASLAFEDKKVYFHSHKGAVEIHIVDSSEKEEPELPDEDDDEEFEEENA